MITRVFGAPRRSPFPPTIPSGKHFSKTIPTTRCEPRKEVPIVYRTVIVKRHGLFQERSAWLLVPAGDSPFSGPLGSPYELVVLPHSELSGSTFALLLLVLVSTLQLLTKSDDIAKMRTGEDAVAKYLQATTFC
jgi:hypothetical protein